VLFNTTIFDQKRTGKGSLRRYTNLGVIEVITPPRRRNAEYPITRFQLTPRGRYSASNPGGQAKQRNRALDRGVV